MLNIAICEDDEIYCEKIEKLVKRYLDKQNITHKIDVYTLGTELIKFGGIDKYNVIFLDVKMDEMDGIETAKQIRIKNKRIFIVFITAFIKYSTIGYQVDAFRYILKDEIETSIVECMNSILVKLKDETKKMTFSFIGEGEVELFIHDILYIESDQHVLKFYMRFDNEKHSMYEKLDNIEKKLKQYGFLRIRKSQMVNMSYIAKVHSYQVKLITGDVLMIPESWFRSVREEYSLYLGRKR